jgi:hypothetical protein
MCFEIIKKYFTKKNDTIQKNEKAVVKFVLENNVIIKPSHSIFS